MDAKVGEETGWLHDFQFLNAVSHSKDYGPLPKACYG
jgi:hypothetical protein